jgi:hypothetical protein
VEEVEGKKIYLLYSNTVSARPTLQDVKKMMMKKKKQMTRKTMPGLEEAQRATQKMRRF